MQRRKIKARAERSLAVWWLLQRQDVRSRTEGDEPGKIIRTLFSRKLPGVLRDILKDICFLLLFCNRVRTQLENALSKRLDCNENQVRLIYQ